MGLPIKVSEENDPDNFVAGHTQAAELGGGDLSSGAKFLTCGTKHVDG